MPLERSIDAEGRLVVISGAGVCSIEETVDSVSRAIGAITKGEIPVGSGILFCIDSIDLKPSDDAVLRITELIRRLQEYLKGFIAIVATQVGKVSTAHMMAFGACGKMGEVRAFIDDSEAREWLLARG